MLLVVSLLSNPVRAACCVSLLWFLTLFNLVDSWLMGGRSIFFFWLYDKPFSFFSFLCNYFLLVSSTSSAVPFPSTFILQQPASSPVFSSFALSLHELGYPKQQFFLLCRWLTHMSLYPAQIWVRYYLFRVIHHIPANWGRVKGKIYRI